MAHHWRDEWLRLLHPSNDNGGFFKPFNGDLYDLYLRNLRKRTDI